MFTQITDIKYVKLNSDDTVHAFCAKSTPCRTLIMLFINNLTITIKKKSENVYHNEFLCTSTSTHCKSSIQIKKKYADPEDCI